MNGVDRRKTPRGAFLGLLVVLCVITYFLCGLFKIPGVTYDNFQKGLLYIVRHPIKNWWTDRTGAFLGIVFLGWVMLVAWYLNYYRNTHFGAENGTERWADVKKMSKILRDKDELKNTYLSENVAVSNSALSNMNMLVIGGSGSYKTTSVVIPNLLMAACTNVILDIKGDLLRKHGNYLKKHGITVKSINFINMEESDRWNPFAYIEKETDLIKLITNMQAAVKPPDAMKGDPFWDDGCALYLQAMFYYEWLMAKEEKRSASMNNILKLVITANKKKNKLPTLEKLDVELAALRVYIRLAYDLQYFKGAKNYMTFSKHLTEIGNMLGGWIKSELDKAGITANQEEYTCTKCGKKINKKVNDFSLKNYGKALCYTCQKTIGNKL